MLNFLNFESIISSLVSVSSELGLIIGVAGFILYLFGWEKCKNLPSIMIGLNLVIQIIGGFLA